MKSLSKMIINEVKYTNYYNIMVKYMLKYFICNVNIKDNKHFFKINNSLRNIQYIIKNL